MGPLFPCVFMSALFSQLFPLPRCVFPISCQPSSCAMGMRRSQPRLWTQAHRWHWAVVSLKFQQGPHFRNAIFPDLWNPPPQHSQPTGKVKESNESGQFLKSSLLPPSFFLSAFLPLSLCHLQREGSLFSSRFRELLKGLGTQVRIQRRKEMSPSRSHLLL